MRILFRRAYTAAIFLVPARATPTITVDDGDPSIEYHGAWTHDPWGNQSVNYGSSVTFTNSSGSTATYRFQGTAIAVFGTFEMSGTFNVHSSYSIDGGAPTDFVPADTFVSFQYNQKFFQSDTLPDEEHTLVITNLGEEFWLDYLVVTQALPPTTKTTTSTGTALQTVQTTSESTAPTIPSTTDKATATVAPASQPETTPSTSAPSSQTPSTLSFSITESAALTSTDVPERPPLYPDSASRSQTSVPASSVASPTSTMAHARSTKFPAGAIAGLAIAALLVLIVAGLVGYRWRRRREGRVRRQGGLTPYDPGMTAIAFEPSEKRDFAHDSASSAVDEGRRLSLAQSAPAYPQTTTQIHIHVSRGAGEGGMLNEDGLVMGRDRRTVFEPLDSPSSVSPLLVRHPRRRLHHEGPPVTQSAGPSRYVGLQDERRRSIDGGVRIAGGPPGSLRQDDADDDIRSGLSTLPPSYQVYPAA
ncbi:hypothetical protein V8D89_000454 [Ganoderma adspersum]